MKAAPYKEEIMHLIHLFLKTSGFQEEAQAIKELYQLPQWIKTNNPLFKKGLTKIVKDYIRKNNKVLQHFNNRSPSKKQEGSQREQKKSRKGSSDSKKHQKHSWMQSFQQPKLLQDIEIDDGRPKPTSIQIFKIQESTKIDKDNHRVKSIKIQIQQSSEESDVEFKKKKKTKAEIKSKKNQKKTEEKSKKMESEGQQSEQQSQPKKKSVKKPISNTQQSSAPKIQANQQVNNELPKRKNWNNKPAQQNVEHKPKFFSRINAQQVMHLKEQLKDNSFEAKFKYGQGGDQWGKHGYQKLRHTRGDSFKKTKSKLKNAAFQSGGIDPNRINSVKIL